MLVTDLDGTLISEEDSISEENLRALHQCREMGIIVALCSGRDPKNVSDIALAAGLEDVSIIALNGAVSLDIPLGDVLEDHRMSGIAAQSCLDILLPHSGDLLLYAGDERLGVSLVTKPRPPRTSAAGTPSISLDTAAYLSEKEIDFRRACYSMAKCGLNKIVYTEMDHPERLRAIRASLAMVSGVEVTSSWFTNIEIMPTGVNKGVAVRSLAQRLGVRMDQVIAFGDNDNDAFMLSQVGYGIAMGNAADSARSAARYTTDTSGRNGLAKGLERFLLMQERPSA
ncbi:MAG: Cof-type HAD-IIB family hydrolase [Oscillospiraceae bacterium]|jgi:Cof subfamily protein (haloacid dehalogenase superfamily)|nr:Cof-type HAD-IIB family hydrolase [Oscillospiraceae bacterium]